jgi:hypothetical protein
MSLHVKHFAFQVVLVTMVGMEMGRQWGVVLCVAVDKLTLRMCVLGQLL